MEASRRTQGAGLVLECMITELKDGRPTWNDWLLLDERKGVSYPDGVQDKDGLLGITYDRDRGSAGEIFSDRAKC